MRVCGTLLRTAAVLLNAERATDSTAETSLVRHCSGHANSDIRHPLMARNQTPIAERGGGKLQG